jgi:hypothetical protein
MNSNENNDDGKATIEEILRQRRIPRQILRAIEETEISLSLENGDLHLTLKTPVIMVSLFIFMTLVWGNIDVAMILGYLSHFLPR